MPKTVRPFPAFSTDRLRLRAPQMEDAEAFGVLLSLPEVTRYSDIPDSATMAGRMMRFMVRLHESRKGCGWIIEDATSGVLIGAIRFNHFDRRWRVGVVGYECHPDFWGRGLMTEALRAIVQRGHQEFRLNRIEAWTLLGNPASDRVLEKAGFRYEGTLRQKAYLRDQYHDLRMFGRTAADPMNWS
jgi:[ribosomal protein S5]-alanine N-acetyltransferase